MSTKKTPKILAFSGSTREGSYNSALLRVATKAAEAAGAEVTIIDLRDFAMPFFNEDEEKAQGLPATVTKLKDLMKAHDGFLIASPEYNSSFSALLKNTIDWATRPREGEGRLECFRGKVVGLLSASAGYYGGYRGLQQVRYVLGNIGVIVLPDMFALPKADSAFAPDGSLKDAGQQKLAEDIARTLVSHLER